MKINARTIMLLLIFAVSLGGCSVLHFDNGLPPTGKTAITTQWHHSFLFGVIEGSGPIDLNDACSGTEWVSVKTENSYASSIATVALWNSLGASALTSGVWTPSTIDIECRDLAQ